MKFRIKDEDGRDYTIEEMIEEKTTDEEPTTETAPQTLTADEISALKGLAAVAPQLMALLSVEEKEHENNPELVDADEDMETTDEEEICDEDEEEILETKAHDSKNSFGSIEKKQANVQDSFEDSISDAWMKRYNGGKN